MRLRLNYYYLLGLEPFVGAETAQRACDSRLTISPPEPTTRVRHQIGAAEGMDRGRRHR